MPDIAAYHDARYTADNIVVAAAGHVEHAADRRARRAPAERRRRGRRSRAPNGNGAVEQARLSFYEKETEQYHICFGGPGIARADERRFALGVLDTIFGGSVSSRLFREVREKRGLAYSVGSYTHEFVDRGFVAMYVGTRADNVAEACEIIGRELAKLRDEGVATTSSPAPRSTSRGAWCSGSRRPGRAWAASRAASSSTSRCSRSTRCSTASTRSAPTRSRRWPPSSTTRTRLAAACVGADEDCFRTAAAHVSEALVA